MYVQDSRQLYVYNRLMYVIQYEWITFISRLYCYSKHSLWHWLHDEHGSNIIWHGITILDSLKLIVAAPSITALPIPPSNIGGYCCSCVPIFERGSSKTMHVAQLQRT